jgi:DNA-binding ferritin-like protein
MGSIVKKVVDVTVGIVSGEYLAKAGGKLLEGVGDVFSSVGLDSIGKEVDRWGGDLYQVGGVLGGDYHDDKKKIERYQQKVNEYGDKVEKFNTSYNLGIDELVERMESLIAFEEIFQMALSNRLEEFEKIEGEELDSMIAQYNQMVEQLNKMVRQLKNDYDFVIGLTQGAFIQKIIGSVLMIVGGLMSDIKDVASGKANSAVWKRLLITTIMIIGIVILMLTPGLQGVALGIAVSLAALNMFMTLDGMYADGAATGAIMGVLDFVFNDLLNLDSLIGSDFEKFDKDHADYQQMVGYVQLAIAIANIYVVWSSAPASSLQSASIADGASPFGATTGTSLVSNTSQAGATGSAISKASSQMSLQTSGVSSAGASGTTEYLGGTLITGGTLDTTTFLGVRFGTYSQIYKAYNTAMSVKDLVSANKQYEDMKEKLKEDYDKLNEAIDTKIDKNMMKHYMDTAYFLQDQQNQIDRYIWSMTSENMYVDPYGTTPVANIRFAPDKDTRMLSFGFEDMFDESRMAGSANYFNNIIDGG